MAYVNKNVEPSDEKDIKEIVPKLIRFMENFHRASEPGIIRGTKRKFDIESYLYEKPEKFPYQEGGNGKIELVPESNIWIKEEEFQKLNESSPITLETLIQDLLKNLLGEENTKFFSEMGSDQFEEVPKDLNNAICKFVNHKLQVAKRITASKCLDKIGTQLIKLRKKLKSRKQ
ncbi:uncharacterized protein LOC122500003 [Leptopilina heterotoma]|uniref:uncharacterized protein LOC122500003 n=1 Tax=Leptopilina heterotoma TaxID=63436 RepID=UPI001CA7DA00|nr:uncharacterized protein LOC122500003 [Leptopilina heterotoma]